MGKKVLGIIIVLAALFFPAEWSKAQPPGTQKPAVKPHAAVIQPPALMRPRVFTVRQLERIRLKDLKGIDLIDLGTKRLTVQEVMDMILRRELKVGDPNNPAAVAQALRDRYSNTVESGVTSYK